MVRIKEVSDLLGKVPSVEAGRDELRNNWQRPIKESRRQRKGTKKFSKTAAQIEEAVAELLAKI